MALLRRGGGSSLCSLRPNHSKSTTLPSGNPFPFAIFFRCCLLAAQQTNETADWYQGTADALRQNLRYLKEDGARNILVLSGDQLYRMDFRDLLRTHRDCRAELTIGVVPVAAGQAGNYGIVRL